MKKLKTIVATMSNKTNHSTNSSNDCKPDNYHVNAKICRLVEQYPCMYDRSHAHYLKKDVVDQAWIKIAEEMNDSISSCKERWRNIRTSYARSINVNKIPSSANRTKPYYLHEELQFLSYHITPGIPVSRRSAPGSISVPVSASAPHFASNSPNSFNDSPIQSDAKSENIKVMVHEESFDSYAAALQNNDSENDQNTHEYNTDDNNGATNQNEHSERNDVIMENEKNIILPVSTPALTSPATTSTANALDTMKLNKQAILCDARDNDNCNSEGNANGVGDKDGDSDGDVVIESTQNDNNKKSFNYACAPPKKRLRIKDNETNSNSIDTLMNDVKPLVVWPPANDYDGIFLQSLLPEMRVMNFHQKILFKRRVYEILTDIFDNHNTTIQATTAATTTTSMATSMNNVVGSNTATSSTSFNNINNNNRNKRKTNQVTTSLAAEVPPMVDIADSNILGNFNDAVEDISPNTSTSANSTGTSTPNMKSPKKTSLQKYQNDFTETSTSISSQTTNPKSTATTLGKVGAITRSCTNTKRLRSSNISSNTSSDNQSQQQQQYQQTIKQELDTNENRVTDQM